MNFKLLKKIFYSLALLLSLGSLGSCEFQREIDYYEKYDVSHLIIHGYVCPQYGVQVIVKKTTSPSDVFADDRIYNANVFLHKSKTEYIQLQHVNDYLFESDSIGFVEVNKSYYIRVESEFGESFSSDETILHTPQIDSVKIVTEPRKMVNVYFTNNYSNGESFLIEKRDYIYGKIVEPFHPEKFNPYNMLINIQAGHNVVELPLYDYNKLDSVQIVLNVISFTLNKFLVSQKNYDISKGDPFYPQPYPVFSNISGGYGIFATHSFETVVAIKY